MENKMDIELVKVLTQPIVPPALHYMTPRKIMGQSKWNKLKREYRSLADHHCMICQRYVSHTPGDWLELHERYEYDFENLVQELVGYVSICHECHMFIHQGLLGIQFQNGEIPTEIYQEILDKGNGLLRKFGLQKIAYPSEEVFLSPNWRLDFDGKLYGENK